MESTVSEIVVRNYLLGNLPEAESDRFEEALVSDPEVLELLGVLEDELIEDYLSQSLDPKERAQFETYFLATPARQEQLRIHRAIIRTVKPPSPHWWALSTKYTVLAAGVAAVIIIAFGIRLLIPRNSDAREGMVALNKAFETERPLEGRVSDLNYAKYPETRGAASAKVDTDALNLALIRFTSGIAKEPGPAHHGLGRLYMAKRDFDMAISQLQLAQKIEPSNAQILSDLGLAYLEKGKHELDPVAVTRDFGLSKDYLDRAIVANSNLAEAFFNRALLFEELKQKENARSDWQSYLAKDPNSEWANVAREHLK